MIVSLKFAGQLIGPLGADQWGLIAYPRQEVSPMEVARAVFAVFRARLW